MKNKAKGLFAVGAVFLLVVTTAATVNAQNAWRHRRAWGGEGAPFMMMFNRGMFFRGLDLTQQQKDQIKTVYDNNKTQIRAVTEENIKARKALQDAIFSGANQATLTNVFQQDVAKSELDGVLLRNKIWTEIQDQHILTPDQMTKLQQRHQNMDQRMQNFLNRLDSKSSGW